jgi:predicted anti-sigma-YlaC factor YlaD
MNEACQRYLEEPEANAEHLRDCAECRNVFDALGLEVEAKPLAVGELPLAPWEGASHRPWQLIAASAVSILALSIVFFVFAGTSPLAALSSEMTRIEAMREILRLTSSAVRTAPLVWQVTLGILFVVVNTILVLLLRRSPRGIDA